MRVVLLFIGLAPWLLNVGFAQSLVAGVSAPLTGDLAAYGSAVRNGITLAAEETPALADEVRFIFEDNQYTPAKALAIFNKFVAADHVNVVYHWGEATLYPIAPLAERHKVPVVAMSVDSEPAIGRRYIIRSINHPDQYAREMLAYTRAKGYRRIGIIKAEDPFLNSLVASLRKQLIGDETLSVLYSALPEQSDFKLAASKIKGRERSLDVLGVYLLSGQVGAFYKQAGAQAVSLPTFGTDIFESRTEIESAKGFMEGAVYPNVFVPELFTRRYIARFKDNSEIAFAYNSYIFANLMGVVALEKKRTASDILHLLLNPPLKEAGLPFTVRRDLDVGQFYDFPMVMRRIEGHEAKDVKG